MRSFINHLLLSSTALLSYANVSAHEITENLSLDGVFSGAAQCQNLAGDTANDNTCKGAAVLQPEFAYRPTRHDRLFLKLGLAKGNALNRVSPFIISSWGADLEDDVENINGSGRNYVLEAWYKKIFEVKNRNRIAVTLGILDASQYLDQNAYANDEYHQFMNPALSNAPNAFFPSYDPGIAAEWLIDDWAFSAVYMDVHQANSPDKYKFYGLQAGYRLKTIVGTGNYRISINADRDFIDQAGKSKQKNDILIMSIDQQFGNQIGIFSRIGWRLDDQPINYRSIYSGGINIKGFTWSRALDNIGIGLVFLDGGNGRILHTRIAEGYYRMVINPYLSFSLDIQYMRDEYTQTADVKGSIYSLRATVNY